MNKRTFSAEEKLKILQEATQSGTSISEVCRRHQISTSQFFGWRKQADQALKEAFANGKRKPKKEEADKQKSQHEIRRLRAVVAEITAEKLALKKLWGICEKKRFTADEKGLILRIFEETMKRSDWRKEQILTLLGISPSRYFAWLRHEENGQGLADRKSPGKTQDRALPAEVQAVIAFALANPAEGYRRLAYQMIDQDVAFFNRSPFSPSTVYRILDQHDLLYRWKRSESEGEGRLWEITWPDQQWHTDLMYLLGERPLVFLSGGFGQLQPLHCALGPVLVDAGRQCGLGDSRGAVDYYRGNPDQLLQARQAKLKAAREKRRKTNQSLEKVA